MDLSQRISQTERSLYVANVADGYHQVGKMIGVTAGGLGGFLIAEAVPVPPLTGTIPFSAAVFGAMAIGEVGLYFGRRRGTSLYEQHHKGALTRLLGT